MSNFTRNLKAIKKLNIEKNQLINHLEFINKNIGKQKSLSTLFKAKNAVFNKLCKIQDVLKLELKLNKILLTRTRLSDLYLDYYNNYLTVRKFSEDNNITLLQGNTIINYGRKINHSMITIHH